MKDTFFYETEKPTIPMKFLKSSLNIITEKPADFFRNFYPVKQDLLTGVQQSLGNMEMLKPSLGQYVKTNFIKFNKITPRLDINSANNRKFNPLHDAH